jgi:hypothetical protein
MVLCFVLLLPPTHGDNSTLPHTSSSMQFILYCLLLRNPALMIKIFSYYIFHYLFCVKINVEQILSWVVTYFPIIVVI